MTEIKMNCINCKTKTVIVTTHPRFGVAIEVSKCTECNTQYSINQILTQKL